MKKPHPQSSFYSVTIIVVVSNRAEDQHLISMTMTMTMKPINNCIQPSDNYVPEY